MTLCINASVQPMTDINMACVEAVAVAEELNTQVAFEFNGVELLAMPNSSPDYLAGQYLEQAPMNRVQQEHHPIITVNAERLRELTRQWINKSVLSHDPVESNAYRMCAHQLEHALRESAIART